MGVIRVPSAPEDNSMFKLAWGYLTSIASGMRHTMGIFLRQITGKEQTATLEWPEQPVTYSDRFKGKHFLTRREDGKVRCTACFLCATACPAECIHIEAGQHKENEIEKFPVRFEIDILRCVFCGFCEEACPVDAIRLGPEYAMVGNVGEKWVYTKDYLTDRTQLHGGVTSVKDENTKHPTIDRDASGEVLESLAPHDGQHHHDDH